MGVLTRKIVAVVVSYNPDVRYLQRVLQRLVSQVDKVVVVDNGSQEYVASWIKTIAIPDIACIPLGSNRGVGAALNVGIGQARQIGAEFALLMDQDSLPRETMVADLLVGYEDLTTEGRRVASIGPRLVDSNSGRVSSHAQFGRWHVGRVPCTEGCRPVPVDFLITSGSLIPMNALESVGPMDETLFIDHVDTEWVLRARARGFESFGDCKALMEHSLGECRERIWFLRWREVAVYKPFRYYYMFRNSVLLYRRPYMTSPWKRIDMVRLVQLAIFILIFGPQRFAKMRMMWRGLRDGAYGKAGPLTLK